jgi:hypothetical protein
VRRWLASIVPPRFRVTASEGRVDVSYLDLWWMASHTALLLTDAADEVEAITTAAYYALNLVQDYVSEDTTDRWPARLGMREMLNPEVSLVDGMLHLCPWTPDAPPAVDPASGRERYASIKCSAYSI